MPFQKYVCWHPEWVEQVMDTEALQPLDHVFMATHHPVPMFRTTLTALYSGNRADRSGRSVYAEDQLLRDFLAPREFAFVPILGEAGTGKSHLVRWLSANIPPGKNRHVLLIPKIDTNLRDVLDRVLRLPGTEGPHFDDYRSRLRRATSELRTEKEAREKLLNNIAVACGPNGPHQMRNLSEAQSYLALHLPNLLYDPYFRGHLLKDEGIIHRLVEHTIGQTARVERLQEKRGFKEEDLPLRAADSQKASAAAREFYGYLIGERTLQQETVAWLNLNLPAAISELLELKGEALLRLMLEVREALGAQRIELVLLIEDFAKLQGIDMQLLEAIIAKPQQEGRGKLCKLRTALACTTGYFRSLFQTVQTRVDFCVTLDLQEQGSADGLMPAAEVQRFIGRYLNAARLNDETLKEWFEATPRDGENAQHPVQNACEGCPHRDACHEAFGASEGVGLYPFSGTAIERMSSRASPEGFNPRLLLKDVLKHVLHSYPDDLREGRFPSQALLEHFKGPQLSAPVRDALSRADSNPQTRTRRLAILDLWSDGRAVIDLAPGIHEAFSLPVLGTQAPPPPANPPPGQEQPTPTPAAPQALPDRLADHLRKLDEWQNGAQLPQTLVNDLREWLFPALRAHINWDTELLLQGQFCGTGGKPFQGRSINFVRQTAQRSQGAAVMLSIPLDGRSFTDSAIAMQGLLLFAHHKSWAFQHDNRPGSYYFRKYAAELDRLSHDILRQVRAPVASGAAWDPVPAAVELLAIGARMAGRPQSSKTALEDQVSALFGSMENVEADHRSAAWKDLFKAFRDHHNTLCDTVLSRVPCTKGGSRAVQVIDASQLAHPLRAIRKDWRPQEAIPDDLWDSLSAIKKVREKVNLLLERAVQEEKDRYVGWHDAVLLAIAPDTARAKVTEAVQAAMQAALGEGVFPHGLKESLEQALEAFGRMRFDQCVQAVDRIRKENDAGVLLGELGRSLHEPMQAISAFIGLCLQFITATRRRVDQDIEQTQGAGELLTAQQKIETQLRLIQEHTEKLCGSDA
jgi:hypothetical protein